VEVVDLIDDELLVALPAMHPLAHKPRLRLRDLRDETWIEAAANGARPTLLTAAARAHGFEPRIRFAAEQWLSKQGLVAAGVGVTLIPGLAVASVRDDIVLRSLGPNAPRRRVVVLLPTGYRAPAAAPFVDLLRAEAAAHGAALVERARLLGADRPAAATAS
jgi:DNA-binding transcriptional LysR family regulator